MQRCGCRKGGRSIDALLQARPSLLAGFRAGSFATVRSTSPDSPLRLAIAPNVKFSLANHRPQIPVPQTKRRTDSRGSLDTSGNFPPLARTEVGDRVRRGQARLSKAIKFLQPLPIKQDQGGQDPDGYRVAAPN